MEQAEMEVMAAGLEAMDFKKVFRTYNSDNKFCVEIWENDKYVNVFFKGERPSHYFFQIDDSKAIKKMFKKEDLLSNDKLSECSAVKDLLSFFGESLSDTNGIDPKFHSFWESRNIKYFIKNQKKILKRQARCKRDMADAQENFSMLKAEAEDLIQEFEKTVGFEFKQLILTKENIIACLEENSDKILA